MILDFSFDQAMRLSYIKRWGIIEMSRVQTVAEHSYNVAMISGSLVSDLSRSKIQLPARLMESVINWALLHDLPEIATGDIPSSLKGSIKEAVDKAEKDMFPQWHGHKMSLSDTVKDIVKIADYVDAIQYADKFCVDSRKNEVIEELRSRMWECIGSADERYGKGAVTKSVMRIFSDHGPERELI